MEVTQARPQRSIVRGGFSVMLERFLDGDQHLMQTASTTYPNHDGVLCVSASPAGCPNSEHPGYWFWKHELLVVPFSGEWAA